MKEYVEVNVRGIGHEGSRTMLVCYRDGSDMYRLVTSVSTRVVDEVIALLRDGSSVRIVSNDIQGNALPDVPGSATRKLTAMPPCGDWSMRGLQEVPFENYLEYMITAEGDGISAETDVELELC